MAIKTMLVFNPPRPELIPPRRVGAIGPAFLSKLVGGGDPVRYRRVRCLACEGTGTDRRRRFKGNACPWTDCDGGTIVILEVAPKED